MRIFDRIFPKAENFRDFSPPEGELPRAAGPFIWVFVKALRWSIAFAIATHTISVICMSVEPWFFGRIVDALTHADRERAWHAALPFVVAYIVICLACSKVLSKLSQMADGRYLPVLIMIVRRRLAAYLFSHSYRYFQDDFAGRLAGKVIEMPQAVHDTVSNTIGQLLWFLINGVTSILLFSVLGWQFALAGVMFFVANTLLYRWGIPIISRYAGDTAAKNQVMRGRYLDSITNILLVKLFSRERHEDDLFSGAMIVSGVARQVELRRGGWIWTGQEIVNVTFQITVLLLCIGGYRSGALSLGQVAMALSLCLSLVMNIWWLLMTMTSYFTNIATINEALATIVVPAEVQDAPHPLSFAPAAHDVMFDNVTFAYPGRPVFDGFTLTIPQGQRVGLVGPSGAGKSTLVQLVLRLFDVQDGAIRIGGQDIRAVSQSDLRHAIAVIPQATDLMHRSIRDNIAYGDPGASEEQVVAAARKAFIHDTILGLADSHGNTGYDALVGERGVKLSGGQRQRIAIARAFLKNAPILILDEATSALDSESERLIQESLAELFKGRTVIVIAHRLSTIAHLDRIVVLENGAIVEDAPHARLIEAGGLYARLWQLQSAGFIGETPGT